jgi:hypothetical protein
MLALEIVCIAAEQFILFMCGYHHREMFAAVRVINFRDVKQICEMVETFIN